MKKSSIISVIFCQYRAWWYVQLAAIYMALVMVFGNGIRHFLFVSVLVHSFFIFFLNLVSIN